MEFRKVLALRGPNIWANFPVLEAWVDLKELKDQPSDNLPGFNDRLMTWLPNLVEHRCSIGERGGFFQRLGGHLPGPHPRTRHAGAAIAGRHAGRASAARARPPKRASTRSPSNTKKKRSAAAPRPWPASCAWRPSTIGRSTSAAEIDEARRSGPRGLPRPEHRGDRRRGQRPRHSRAQRLNSASLVQLGYGAQQRRILAAETDRTSAIAESIAQDKELTRTLLGQLGVPVPAGRPVNDADDAWAAARGDRRCRWSSSRSTATRAAAWPRT